MNIFDEMYSKLNKTHDFILTPCDTDSISFCKNDGSEFSEEEQESLLNEINSFMPNFITYAHDGYFPKIVILKAKNYITYDGVKIKKKGSSLKSSKTEKGISDLLNQVIEAMVFDKGEEEIICIYTNFIKEVNNLKDISRWVSKQTYTEKMINGIRANETKKVDAVVGKDLQMGDKFYVYTTIDEKLKCQEDWVNDHNPNKLMKRIFDTMKIFGNILDIKLFPNYTLKKNKLLLNNLLSLQLL